MIVVTHVQDQAVWIEYMRMYNYDYSGVERAKSEYEEHNGPLSKVLHPNDVVEYIKDLDTVGGKSDI